MHGINIGMYNAYKCKIAFQRVILPKTENSCGCHKNSLLKYSYSINDLNDLSVSLSNIKETEKYNFYIQEI